MIHHRARHIVTGITPSLDTLKEIALLAANKTLA
jgi:hypothetical protein